MSRRRTGATPAAWVLRLVVALGPLVAVLAGTLAGARPSVLLLLAVGSLATVAAALPDSGAGAVVLLLVGGWWGLRVDGLPAVLLLASAALVAAHVAGVLAAYGPAHLRLPGALVRRWARRGLLLWSVSVLLYLGGLAARSLPVPPAAWLVAMLLATGAALAAGRVLAADEA